MPILAGEQQRKFRAPVRQRFLRQFVDALSALDTVADSGRTIPSKSRQVNSAGLRSKNSPHANFAHGGKPLRAARIWRLACFDVSRCVRTARP